jgi:hypothetical protein
VYGHDAEARERGLTPDERLRLHQERSRPVMDRLHTWLETQLALYQAKARGRNCYQMHSVVAHPSGMEPAFLKTR